MHFYALLCTSLHFFALLCTPIHSQLGVHFTHALPNGSAYFFSFLCTPRTHFLNNFFITFFGSGSAWFSSILCTPRFLLLFLVLGVHDFGHFYALPDFQSFFYHFFWFWECMIFLNFMHSLISISFFWFWECMILVIFMHSQIFGTFSISFFGSGSAWFSSILCTPRFPKLVY